MTHIMLDLETWGKKPGCDIRSIGACVFDPIAGYVAIPSGDENNDTKSFYVATENPVTGWVDYGIPPNENERVYKYKYQLTRDPETVQWWNDQSEEAQAAFANPVDLHKACQKFTSLICNALPFARQSDNAPDDIRLWANDPHFDCSILAAVYDAVELPVPWHYRAPRSMKTVCELAGITRDDMAAFNHGTAHHALDDAISQSMIVCEAYKRLGLQREPMWNWGGGR